MREKNMEDQSQVHPEYQETPFSYTQEAKVVATSFQVGYPYDWAIFVIPIDKWMCSGFEGCFIHFYDCTFQKFGV